MAYEKLFSPVRIGTLELPNRAVMAPMATGYCDPQGYVTEKLIAYHVERARGGIAYNVPGHMAILPEGRTNRTMLCIYDDSYVEGLARLCTAVHREGGRIFFQINHAGTKCLADLLPGRHVVGPTDVPAPGPGFRTPRALDRDGMEEITEAWAQATRRAREAGADGIEVHMAHGYLLSDFLNSAVNTREDEYGGDLRGRVNFPLQVLHRVREQVGSDYPLTARFSAEGSPYTGFDLETCRTIGQNLEEHGADAVSLSTLSPWTIAPYYLERGGATLPAAAVKEAVGVPVITVNRIVQPRQAEAILQEEKADIVAMGRALLADPHWVGKARAGREDEIIPCIACNVGCLMRRPTGGVEAACTANPRTGHEHLWGDDKAAKPRKVWVVGAGPGGVSAALEAKARGHEVTLFEKGSRIGGAFLIAAAPPGKGELGEILRYWEAELARRGVELKLGTEVSANDVLGAKPDALVVATGAAQHLPPEGTAGGLKSITAGDLLAGREEAGERVLVVGGGSVGLESADFLAASGKRVVVVEMLAAAGEDLARGVKEFLIDRLDRSGVEVLTEATLARAEPGRAVIQQAGGTETREVDTIVWAIGFSPCRELAEALAGSDLEIKVIGDAAEPRTALEATWEGASAAREL
jgi:2,4-dienoyl-CoA reductase-like NADH-dependent reductase (Old Yellow Enzyme family)/thioredoxin reductase